MGYFCNLLCDFTWLRHEKWSYDLMDESPWLLPTTLPSLILMGLWKWRCDIFVAPSRDHIIKRTWYVKDSNLKSQPYQVSCLSLVYTKTRKVLSLFFLAGIRMDLLILAMKNAIEWKPLLFLSFYLSLRSK